MLCQTCGTESSTGQKFCIQCGAVLDVPAAAGQVFSASTFAPPSPESLIVKELPPPPTGVDATTVVAATVVSPVVASAPPAPPTAPPLVVTPAASVVDTAQIAVTTAAPTEAIHIIEQTPPTQVWDTVATPLESGAPAMAEREARSGGALATLAGLAGVATIVGSFLPQLNVKSDAPIPSYLGDFKLNDFRGTNLQVAFIAAGLVLLIGAMLTAAGRRFGRGLLGGAGLALVPAVACVYGFISSVRDSADNAATTAHASGQGGTFFDSQPGAGFYILLAAAGLGLFAFFASLGRSNKERAHGLNSVLCALGAIASVIAGLGQLIPQHGAKIGDNFSDQLGNNVFIYGRLAMAVLVAGCGVLGFMRRSRWGIGLALGGLALYAWQWLSSFADLGDLPAPPAFINPGATGVKPHIVTTVGVLAMVVVGVLALVTARREQTDYV